MTYISVLDVLKCLCGLIFRASGLPLSTTENTEVSGNFYGWLAILKRIDI